VVLAAIKEVRLPAWLGGVVSQLAAASYMAYLAHPLVLHITKYVLPEKIAFFHDNVPAAIFLTYFGTLAAGLVGTVIWQQVSSRTLELFNRRTQQTAA
jgi:predicted PurR-regulated permease PerM